MDCPLGALSEQQVALENGARLSNLQGRSDGYIGIYTPSKNQFTLKNLCVCSSPVTQDRFDICSRVWDINIMF